jgi:hypothetical protein
LTTGPTFESDHAYTARLTDAEFWRPWIGEILGRHGLAGTGADPVAGVGGSRPTFLCGDVVVKPFGHVPAWRASHAAERAAHVLLATDPAIAAPRVLAEGTLGGDWPYLVTTLMPGTAWSDTELTVPRRIAVAEDLGRQVRRWHALGPAGVATGWPALDIAAAARRSSLPGHLVDQAAGYVARLPHDEPVFTHGDVTDRHVFVADGRLAGVIDWGDVAVADRHYEIVQLHRALFDCDIALLRAFLIAADWPMTPDFPRRALGFALIRQAVGLTQHLTMNVFAPIAAHYPLADIATLDELAQAEFAV